MQVMHLLLTWEIFLDMLPSYVRTHQDASWKVSLHIEDWSTNRLLKHKIFKLFFVERLRNVEKILTLKEINLN